MGGIDGCILLLNVLLVIHMITYFRVKYSVSHNSQWQVPTGRDCLMAAEEEGKQMHQSRMMEEVGALLLQGRERHSQLHQQAERAGEDSQLHRAEVVQL